jgi:hypothetical protein
MFFHKWKKLEALLGTREVNLCWIWDSIRLAVHDLIVSGKMMEFHQSLARKKKCHSASTLLSKKTSCSNLGVLLSLGGSPASDRKSALR